MALKVVIDNTNVEALQIYNFRDIADCARRFANELEAKEHGNVQRVIVVVQTDEGVGLNIWGEDAASGYEVSGILEAAQLRALDDDE